LIIEEFNASVRKLIAAKLQNSKKELTKLTEFRDETTRAIISEHEQHTEAQLLPHLKLKNFIDLQQSEQTRSLEQQRQDEIGLILDLNVKFNPESKDAVHYENELKALSLLGTLKPENRDETLKQFEFVLQCLLEN
jgi:hypothetical protein